MTFGLSFLKGAPFWVWGVFLYLVIIGIQSLHEQRMYLYRFLFMPIFFTSWSIYSISSTYSLTLQLFSIWFSLYAVGVFLGHLFFYALKIKINSEKREVVLPGTIVPLILAILFFGVKYSLGVTYALKPYMRENALLIALDLVVSETVFGMLTGRCIAVFYAYLKNRKLF